MQTDSVGIGSDKDGLPSGSDIFPGSTQDVEIVQQMVAKLKSMGIQHPFSFPMKVREVKTGQSWEQIARLFRRLHVAELIPDAGVVFRRSELSKEHKAVLKVLRILSPKEIQDVNMIPNGTPNRRLDGDTLPIHQHLYPICATTNCRSCVTDSLTEFDM